MSQPNFLVHVHYRLDLPLAVAERIVGHPCVIDGEDDDSFICALEDAVADNLPDLMAEYVAGDPDVEAT